MTKPSRESGGSQALLAWLLTALFIIGLATPISSFALTRTYFASSVTSESMAALWVAKDRGLFNKYGLDVQFILMPRSAVTIASLVAGEIDMAIVGPGNLLNAAAGGAEVVGVGNLVQRLDYSLVSRPEIKKAEDLRGKRVAISAAEGLSNVALKSPQTMQAATSLRASIHARSCWTWKSRSESSPRDMKRCVT